MSLSFRDWDSPKRKCCESQVFFVTAMHEFWFMRVPTPTNALITCLGGKSDKSPLSKQIVLNKTEFIAWYPSTKKGYTKGSSIWVLIRACLLSLIIIWRCPWCSRYRRRKWTRRHEFKSWTRLIAFRIALIPLGKVWIQLFSLQLWVNSRTD